jgi:NADPH-dependent glutamate synthase beta subunit-like oxidoreductase
MGFDHIALCMGAGGPTVLDIPNGLARGVRTASDFLMALQLTGAAKADSIANMQLRLPVVVIGGGLTAIDTATESLAYYVVQVEKFLHRYEALVAERSARTRPRRLERRGARDRRGVPGHARAIRAERAGRGGPGANRDHRRAAAVTGAASPSPTAALIDSPSYTLNHEEVEKALEEGIRFAEGLTPVASTWTTTARARGIRCA